MSPRDTTRRTVLKTSAGLLAAGTGLAALTGSAAAHFPPGLDIDITPGSDENPVNPRSNGVTTVAVITTDAFDPMDEDVRYRFGAPDAVAAGGGATVERATTKDVNGDGREDLVLQFRADEAGFDDDESEGELRWDRDESREHGRSGRDSVRVVGRN